MFEPDRAYTEGEDLKIDLPEMSPAVVICMINHLPSMGRALACGVQHTTTLVRVVTLSDSPPLRK